MANSHAAALASAGHHSGLCRPHMLRITDPTIFVFGGQLPVKPPSYSEVGLLGHLAVL